MKKSILFTLLMLLPQWTLLAQFDSKMKHHVIIAIDEVMQKTKAPWFQKAEAFNRLSARLDDTIFREGDYLSIVGFSTDECAEDLNDFTYILENVLDVDTIRLGWMPYDKSLMDKIAQRWSEIMDPAHRKHKGKDPFSMISLAKMYAFAPVKKTNANHYVNRTFVLLITDRRYNGSDFFEERIGKIIQTHDIYKEAINITFFNPNITPMMMQAYGQRVSSEYFIRQLNNDYEQQPSHQYVDICEYIPLQSGLTLPTLLDYPAGSITAQRIKGGLYKLDINTSSRHNPRYNILQLRYCIKDTYDCVLLDTLCKADIGVDGDYEPIEQFKITYELGANLDAASVTIDVWVGLNDGVYNATVLSPIKEAPEHLAPKGLSVTIPIEYEKTAKILGLVKLPGKLQFDDNQEYANAWVSAAAFTLAAILLIMLLVLLIRRLHSHRITIEDIDIQKID